ncbi:serine protease inhibitor Kazal-type 1-like [Biomphalaria glabrata]|uniref:Serine protease inhibitor Kazal-type 1-like n=1 Tax=Biomphalaria glabrata TaxID=6526 RepID=A0A9U8EA94_BIOGL|nr:serine protease inhibitor Kazal-type 1-like [Biomphalaria glabrata]XP_013079760.2 serine protease inhibitor Kazal-type 1-like [Biomphalaria glabrata]XP_013079761.2 serine protease inhibitor Kazal-type 1-like [Biomphalaria glabrata]
MAMSVLVYTLSAVVILSLCLNAEAQSTTRPCDRNCPCTFNPVCGSDRITYSSECTLKAANCDRANPVTVESTGVCTRGGRHSHGGWRRGGRGGNQGSTAAEEK